MCVSCNVRDAIRDGVSTVIMASFRWWSTFPLRCPSTPPASNARPI
jgi:hypothetical protein